MTRLSAKSERRQRLESGRHLFGRIGVNGAGAAVEVARQVDQLDVGGQRQPLPAACGSDDSSDSKDDSATTETTEAGESAEAGSETTEATDSDGGGSGGGSLVDQAVDKAVAEAEADGVTLEIMATPGHTPESISVLVFEHGTDEVAHGVLTGERVVYHLDSGEMEAGEPGGRVNMTIAPKPKAAKPATEAPKS